MAKLHKLSEIAAGKDKNIIKRGEISCNTILYLAKIVLLMRSLHSKVICIILYITWWMMKYLGASCLFRKFMLNFAAKREYMELTKQDRRVLKDIIRIGILRRCEEWLAETSALISKEYVDDENAFDRCLEVTKRSRDFFKEAMRREDYYRNTMIELGIENLLFEGYLTDADFVGCREELRTYILERHQQLKNMRVEEQ